MPKKGITPLIAVVMLIAVVIGLIVIVSPWVINMATDLTNTTADQATQDINCNAAGYAFVTDYGTNGVKWNISQQDDSMSAMIENTGQVNLWNFSFVVTINATTDIAIYEYQATDATDKTGSDPLKPGRKVLLNASITDDSNGTVTNVRITNSGCPTIYAEQDL